MARKNNENKKAKNVLLSCFWFAAGFTLTAIFLLSSIMIILQYIYKDKVYEGLIAENVYVGGKTKQEVENIFEQKNSVIKNSLFSFSYNDNYATFSGTTANLGYNSKLIADQVYGLGKSNSPLTNFYIILLAYSSGLRLNPTYNIQDEKLQNILVNLNKDIYKEPVEALFKIENNKVVAFKESANGQAVDYVVLNKILEENIKEILKSKQEKNIVINIPIKTLTPSKTTEEANNLGIVETIGKGESFFKGSIPNRIYNVNLATSKINGILIAPGETFSFNDSLGDVSKFTGYKEAYVIKAGKTVLGDGGGVCQVSTTLFRAVLESGLPIIERHAHAYRVGYYEQNSLPGLDATVFSPSVDFKFKNDMNNYVLIQGSFDPENLNISFNLYGKKDGRIVELTKPVIKNQTPPPPPSYEDDPTLQKGIVKQVEYEAYGANTVFTRKVTRDGQMILNDTFTSSYTPWKAVFLKGTKEG